MPVYESRIEFESFRLYFIFKFKWFFGCYLFFSRDFLIFLVYFVLVVDCDSFISSYSIRSSIKIVFFARIVIVQCSYTLDLVLHFRYKFDSGTPQTTRHKTVWKLMRSHFWLSMYLALKAKVRVFLLKVQCDGFPFGLNRHRWMYRRVLLLCTKWIE